MDVNEIKLFEQQDEFVFSDKRFSAYIGGFGNGKTLAGSIKAYLHCQQKDAFFLIGRRHATDLNDSTQRDFLNLFGHLGKFSPKNGSFKFYRDGKMYSEVIFRHLDDMQALTNMNLSGFWIDQAEEVSEDAFDFLIGRIRRPVQRREGFVTANPNGHDWLWRRYLKKVGVDGKPLPNANDYQLVTASTLANRGNLPEDYIKGLMSQPPEWRKRFVEGSFDVFSGQIYDEFNPRIHTLRQPFEIPQAFERFRAIDHGTAHATCCLWFAVDFDGNIFVYQEYYREDEAVSKHVEAINALSRVRTTKGDVMTDQYKYTVIDPSTHAKTKEKNGYRFSVADEYLDAGISTIAAQNDVRAGINRVKEYLKIREDRYHPFLKDEEDYPLQGSPKLFIFPQCENLIEEISQYRWKSYSGKMLANTERDDPKEAPVKRKDHACFVAGTKILMGNLEEKNIESIMTNDTVMTPFGKSKVVSVEKTGIKEVTAYTPFFVSTSNHPVLTSNGVAPVDSIRYDSYIWINRNRKQFTFMEYLIGGILTQRKEVKDFIFDALLIRSLEARQVIFIGTFGNQHTVQSQKDILSTIKMATTITALNHLYSLLKENTLNYMSGDEERISESILLELDRLLKDGMLLKKEKSGTQKMEDMLGMTDSPFLQYVYNAVEYTVHSSLVEASIVTKIAKPERLGKEEVYNIATEHGMYFANEVLVSNCDALRYGIMSRPQSPSLREGMEPWIYSNPLELARRAQSMGVTVNDLILGRYSQTKIRHSNSGISHQKNLHERVMQ